MHTIANRENHGDWDFDLLQANRHSSSMKTQTRPEILAELKIISQITKETFSRNETKTIDGLIKNIRTYPEAGLRYVKLDRESLNLVVYSNGSYTTDKDVTSQVRYLIFISDKQYRANLFDYASNKYTRVVSFALGS